MIKAELKVGDKGTWEGKIEKVIYVGQNNYAIISVRLKDGSIIKAEGTFECPQKDATVKMTGQVVYNEKYASNQIKVSKSELSVTDDYVIATKFLTSGAINGIGDKTAELLINTYGTDIISYMTDIDKLTKIKGITEKKAAKIAKSFEEQKQLLSIFATVKGRITLNQATKINEKYGKESAYVLKNNPYTLIYDIDNFGFTTVDDIAVKSGYELLGDARLCAAVSYVLNNAENSEGHLFIPLNEVVETAQALVHSLKELKNIFYRKVYNLSAIPDDTPEWDGCVLASLVKDHSKKTNNLINKWMDGNKESIIKSYKLTILEQQTLDFYTEAAKSIKQKIKDALKDKTLEIKNEEYDVEQLKLENIKFVTVILNNGTKILYNKNTYLCERDVAKNLLSMLDKGVLKDIPKDKIKSSISQIEANENIKLLDDQKTAVEMAINNRISVITGGPGRGKTTIIRAIIKAWNSNNIILLAPTGKAAKRMEESTDWPAMTIHRYLLKNETIMNDDTLFIIDEASMIDIKLARKLLRSCVRGQICFVGDIDQLPSVGAGAFLEDLIKSNVIPCTKLEHCHRNSGSILYNSTVINEGLSIQHLEIDTHFRTLWLQDAQSTFTNILNIYSKQLDTYDPKDMIVLTPMRGHITGVDRLNTELQKIANPPAYNKKEITIGKIDKMILREGDRVMHTKNDYNISIVKNDVYDKGVFNGETGTITEIDYIEDVVTVTFDDGKIAFYERKNLNELTLAYALTYHKSQGSEYKFVICALTTGDYVLLQKKILYTGESRAKEKCFFIGSAKAFQLAINNVSAINQGRNTSLKEFLRKGAA